MRISLRNTLIILLITMSNKLISNDLNIGNNQINFVNAQLSNDTNIKYLSYNNNLILAHLKNEIQFKVFSQENDSTSFSHFKLNFISPDSLNDIKSEINSMSNIIYVNQNDSIKYINDLSTYKNLYYSNLYNNVDFKLIIKKNKMQFNFNIIDINSIAKIKFKFSNLDSLRVLADSSLMLFTNLGTLNLNKLKYVQYDSIKVDSVIKVINYVINNDTLSFDFLNLDSTKKISTIIDNYDKRKNYVNIKQSERNLNEYSLFSTKDNYDNYYTINLIRENSALSWSEYSNTITKIKHFYFDNYQIFRYNNRFELINSKNLFFCKDTNSIELISFKHTPKNSLVLIGNSKSQLNGQFKDCFDSLENKKQFISNKSNGFILMSNFNGDIYNSNYINFDSTIADIKLTNLSNIDNELYLTGIVDSMTIFNKSNYRLKYNKNSNFKTFIIKYDRFFNDNSTFFISSNNNNEYLTLDNGIMQISKIGEKTFVFTGITNSQTLLDTTLINKNNSSNDNIIISINENLDSIYRAMVISGNNNEGLFNNKSNYYLNKSNLIKLNDSIIFVNFISNSSTFDNESSSITKNIKTNNYYNCINMLVNNNTKLISKLLFINSNSNQELVKTEFLNNEFFLLLNSTSNTFEQPIIKDTLITDSISYSSLHKGMILKIDNNLSLSKDNNNVSYKPLWFTFVESNTSDSYIKDFQLSNSFLYLSGYSKTGLFYSKNDYQSNGNNSNNLYDAFNIQLFLGVLE